MIKKYLSILAFILACTIAHAEKSGKILYFQAPSSAPKEVELYAKTTHIQKISLPRHQFSKTFSIPTNGEFVLSVSDKVYDPESIPTGLPSVTIPASWSKFLILVFNDPTNSILPLKLKAIDASEDEFGNGDVKIINYTKNYVVGNLADKELKLKPRSQVTFSDLGTPYKPYKVKMKLIKPSNKDEERGFISQAWRSDPKVRLLVFIYHPEDKVRPQYHATTIRRL